MGKRKLVALVSLSSWCLLMVVWLFLMVPWIFLPFVIVVFPDHTHYILCRRLVTLKHGLHHWKVSEYELEMPLTRSRTVLEFDHEIILQ